MAPWNLEATKVLVLASFGDEQAKPLWAALQSIHKRQYIAGYHFSEYKRLLSEKLDPQLAVKHPLELMLAPDVEDRQSIHALHLQVLAHVLACMQSMHALGDTLAFAIAIALGLNLGADRLIESKISIDTVVKRLERGGQFTNLRGELNEFQSNSSFIYLADIVNHTKHRSIIVADFHFDATGEASSLYDLRFPAFKFKSRSYEQRSVATLLEPLYAWLSPQVVVCGNALNAILGAGD